MGMISRREFASLCSGTLAMGGLLAAFPGAARASNFFAAEDAVEDLTALSLTEAAARVRKEA